MRQPLHPRPLAAGRAARPGPVARYRQPPPAARQRPVPRGHPQRRGAPEPAAVPLPDRQCAAPARGRRQQLPVRSAPAAGALRPGQPCPAACRRPAPGAGRARRPARPAQPAAQPAPAARRAVPVPVLAGQLWHRRPAALPAGSLVHRAGGHEPLAGRPGPALAMQLQPRPAALRGAVLGTPGRDGTLRRAAGPDAPAARVPCTSPGPAPRSPPGAPRSSRAWRSSTAWAFAPACWIACTATCWRISANRCNWRAWPWPWA